MSNSNSNGEVKISRKRYYNLMNKGMDALLKTVYLPSNAHPRNRLTYQNIMQIKRAIQARRRPNNANKPMTRTNHNFRTSNGHRVRISEYGINGTPKGSITWNVHKMRPDGRLIVYATMARNNNRPINLNNLDVYFSSAFYPDKPKNEMALRIQRAWRAKKEQGPFSHPVIKTILKRHIMTRLPKENKKSMLAATRKASSLNRNMIERSRRVDPFWRALLNNVTRRSILKGSTAMLTGTEYVKLGPGGLKKTVYNPETGQRNIPASMRESAWQNVRRIRHPKVGKPSS